MHIICSHGRGGSPDDAIIQKLAQTANALGHSVECVYDDDIQHEPDARAARLIEHIQLIKDNLPLILLGFSMGGYTSVLAAERCPQVHGLFLIAPALYLPHYEQHRYRSDLRNVEIVHGWSDDIVIYEHSVRFARSCNAPLHILPGSHMLLSQLERISELFSYYLQRLTRSN